MFKALRTLRFQNWWISKIPPLLSYAYAVLLVTAVRPGAAWDDLLLLIAWMIGAAAFGHYINDVFDLDDDLAAGKHNQTAIHSTLKKWSIAAGLVAFTLAPWLLLPVNPWNGALVLVHLVIFLLYSAPPVRMKERGILAVAADAVYAHVIPGLVVLLTLLPADHIPAYGGFIGLFAGWQFLIGCRNILNHHIDDYENDLRSGTTTTATLFGDGSVKRIVKRVYIPLEVVALLAVCYTLPGPFPILIGCFLGYVVYSFWREVTFLREKLLEEVVIVGRYDYLSGILLNEWYEKWLPLIILVWLSIADPIYLVFAAIHIFLFYNLMVTFRKDLYFVIYMFYEIVRQTYFAIQKPTRHFFTSTLPRLRNMSYWKVRLFFERIWQRFYWGIVLFFRRSYWAWMRLYRDHIVRIAWDIAKVYYRVEYRLWKRYYKPLKDRWNQKQEKEPHE